jgi:hypothetical protein
MLPRTTQQSYSAALVRESQIEPWLAFANTLLAGAKSSHGTTQPKMNPQPDLRSGTKVDAAEKGLDVRKKTFLGIREKCFFLTSPFIEPAKSLAQDENGRTKTKINRDGQECPSYTFAYTKTSPGKAVRVRPARVF